MAAMECNAAEEYIAKANAEHGTADAVALANVKLAREYFDKADVAIRNAILRPELS